jgi:hypothetical protein
MLHDDFLTQDGKREVNETVTKYENNGTRSEEKNFSPEFDREEAKKKLELMVLLNNLYLCLVLIYHKKYC